MSVNYRERYQLLIIMKRSFSNNRSQCRPISVFTFVLLNIFLLASGSSNAQTFTSSPYSRYGIGDVNQGSFSQNFAMGSTGIALSNPTFVNLLNPASYSFELTVFEIGLKSNSVQLSNDSLIQNSNNTSLAYLAFGIPLTKWWGVSFGLLPYSSVGYNIGNQEDRLNIGSVQYLYEGSGGINKAYIGNSFKIKEKFSVGFNASYLFGTLNKERRAIYDNSLVPFNTRITNSTVISDFTFDFGVQYKQKLSEKWNLDLGAVYAAEDNINASNHFLAVTYKPGTVNDQIKDTVAFSIDEKGKITLPQSMGFGFSLQRGNNLLIAADYSMKDWSTYKSFGQTDSLKNSSQVSIGAHYTPDPNAVTTVSGYWKIIEYRVGIRYADTHLQLKNTPIKEYGISFGTGLPLRRSRSVINIGFELGQRGTTESGLIKEQFINANFGITINDKWFKKRKYD